MYEMKIKAAGLCKGIKRRCLLLGLAFFAVAFSSAVCFAAGIMSAVYSPEKILDGVLALMGFSVTRLPAALIRLLVPLMLGSAVFLFICASSLLFTLKAEFCFVTDKNQTRPGSFLSVKSGVRYIKYAVLLRIKKTGLFIRIFAPFFIQLCLFYILLVYFGTDRFTFAVAACVLILSALFSGVCYFVRCRAYDSSLYLLYLNCMLAPSDALLSSEEKTRGKLIPLAFYRLSVLPARLLCFFLLPLPFCLSYAGVFGALVSEKLYGENKRTVKQPAVVFYVNKRSVIKEISADD